MYEQKKLPLNTFKKERGRMLRIELVFHETLRHERKIINTEKMPVCRHTFPPIMTRLQFQTQKLLSYFEKMSPFWLTVDYVYSKTGWLKRVWSSNTVQMIKKEYQ